MDIKLPSAVNKYNRTNKNKKEQAIIQQSHDEVYAKYNYTAIEKRIRYTLEFLANQETNVDTLLGRVDIDNLKRRYATIPISILMGNSKSHNYDDIRKSIDSFNTKTVWYHDNEGNWVKTYPLIAVYLTQVRGCVVLKIDNDVWNSFTNESSFHSKIDILEAMQFSSPVQMRLYEIANDIAHTGEHCKEFSIDFLREMFCAAEKYKTTADFIRALEKSAKKLESSSIRLLINKISEGSSHKITKLELTPVPISDEKIIEKNTKEFLKKYGLRGVLAPYEIQCLRNAKFTEEGICNNITTLKIRQIQSRIEKNDTRAFGDLINKLNEKSQDKTNPQGWIIETIKAINKK